MDTYEIDLWEILSTLYRWRYLVLLFILIPGIFSYIFCEFFLDKQYQTDIWIKVGDEFLTSNNEADINYLKSYLFLGEVVNYMKSKGFDDLVNQTDKVKFNISKDMVKISYTHTKDFNINVFLNNWLSMAKINMMLTESNNMSVNVSNDLEAIRMHISNLEKKSNEIKNILEEEGQYILNEVLPKDNINTQHVQILVYKEINPNYLEFKNQLNSITLKIGQLSNLSKMATELQNNIQQNIMVVEKILNDSTEVDFDVILNKLLGLGRDYNIYLQERQITLGDSSRLNRVVEPFKLMSSVYTGDMPVSPNTTLNVIVACFLGLFLGIIFIFFFEYVKENLKRDRSAANSL